MVVQTPCVGVCKMHLVHRVCKGCMRSPLELRIWNTATSEKRLEIIDQCIIRKELYGDIND